MGSNGLAFILVVITVCLVGKTNTTDVSILQGSEDPFQCNGKLRLRCSYNGSAACCSNIKSWRADASVITIGTDENSKYTQEVFSSLNYFNLVINKLEISDLNKKYSCQYLTDISTNIDPSGKLHCNKCGGFGFLWILIGVAVAYLVCVIIVQFKVKPKWNMEKIIVISVVSILISLMVSGAIAVPVCIVESLCLDSPRLDPLFILLGLAVELGLFFILGMCIGKSKGSGGADSSGSRPPQGVRRPEIRESAQAGAHTRTENSSPKKNEYASKLDSVPKGRPLPQIGGNSPRELPQLDQGKNNITKLDPLVVFEDPGEKKKKKKKRKKQQENDEVET